jgi:hypothetical protein
MDYHFVYICISLAVVVYMVSVYFTIKIATKRELNRGRWLFYAFYFNVFALFYLLFSESTRKPQEGNKSEGKRPGRP